MTAVQSALMQEPRYLEMRHREYRQDMGIFGKMVFDIYTLMPPMIRVYENGKFEQVIAPEYQKAIDNVMQKRNEFVKRNYPEFYKEY